MCRRCMTSTMAPLILSSRRLNKRIADPLFEVEPPRVGVRVGRLQGVIDNNEVAAAARERASGRGGEPEPAPRSHELSLCRLGRIEPSGGEDVLVPGRRHHRTAVTRVLGGKVSRITDADDAPRRIAAEQPGGQCHRCADRFETARRHQDDEALELARGHTVKRMANRLEVPIGPERLAWANGLERFLHEGAEVGLEGIPQHALGRGLFRTCECLDCHDSLFPGRCFDC